MPSFALTTHGLAAVLGMAIFTVTGCTVPLDRAGYVEAWYYDRLTPYYENDLALSPRVHLRAVEELVGQDVAQPDGSVLHLDVLRPDIEIFFASPVSDEGDRLRLVLTAIAETCPKTDSSGLEAKIAFSSPSYLVLTSLPCLGHAT